MTTSPFLEIVVQARDVQPNDWVLLQFPDLSDQWMEVMTVDTAAEAVTLRLPDRTVISRVPCVAFQFWGGSEMSATPSTQIKIRRARDGYRNLHMEFIPDRSAVRPEMSDDEAVAATVWTCGECGAVGSLESLRSRMCNHVYETCEFCGGNDDTNECKLDCSGIAELLSDPSNMVIDGSEGQETN